LSFEDWQKENQSGFSKWQQQNVATMPGDPNEEISIAEDVLKKAVDLELSIEDVENYYPQFEAAPEDSRLSQLFQRYIRDPITEKTGLFPYVTDFGDPRRSEKSVGEKIKTLVNEAPAAAVHVASEYVSGLGLNAPDILAQEFDRYILNSEKPVTSLSELVFKIAPKMHKLDELEKSAKITGQLFNFLGGLKTARKILGPLINRLPVRESLRFMFGTGVKLGTVSLTQEVADTITKGEDIDWNRIHKSAGWGVIFGGAESLAGKLAQYKDVKEVLKFEPRLKVVPKSLLNRMAEAGRARAGGMPKKTWMKTYGEDARKFIDHLRVISEQPLLPGKEVVAPTVKPVKAKVVPKKPAPKKPAIVKVKPK
jgi:hypothetical protein